MIAQSVFRQLLPWARRQPPADGVLPFDAHAEQTQMSHTMLRCAAQLLARPGDERGGTLEQVRSFCDALTCASQHLCLCWTWFGDAATPVIVPDIVAGRAAAYGRELRIERSALSNLGPAFRTLAGRRSEPFNVNESSLYPPWRRAARAHGVRSVLALPLGAEGDARRGIFLLYADVPDYFSQVGLALFEAVADLIGAVLSQSARNERLEHEARTDPLTGLHNRAAGHGSLQSLRQTQRDRPLSLLLLDLDHFKLVNDRHGHAGGDAVLRSAAERLRGVLRRKDGVARWGGEEFVVWLPETRLADALQVAEKLRAAMAHPPHALPGGELIDVTVSVGVAETAAGEPLEATLRRADQAMYKAKQVGRDRVQAA